MDDLYQIYKQSTKIITDSRGNCFGALFFALHGESFDGNQFASEVLKKGAIAVVVDDPQLRNKKNHYYVEDTLIALQELARYHRKKLNIPIIAITGTNGKTSTKELMATVLSQKFQVAYTKGNLNNHIGVPLTILTINSLHNIAIVEMGANHIGEIDCLCKIAQPTHGLITNIGRAHLEGFGSVEGIIQAKGELYDYLRLSAGQVFVNASNELLLSMSHGMDQLLYGGDTSESFIHGRLNKENLFLNFEWSFSNTSLVHSLITNMVGSYNFENALAAIAVGVRFSVSATDIDHAIQTYNPGNHRSQKVDTGKNVLVLDAYNANPSSMELAIINFAIQPQAILILGDMKELGEYSHHEHLHLVQLIREQNFKHAYLVGQEFYACKDEMLSDVISYFEDKASLENQLLITPLSGQTILVKGSRGMKMETLLSVL